MATSIKVNGTGAKRYQFPNGMKWESCSFSDRDHPDSWSHIQCHNGIWMAGGNSFAGIYRSIDGKTWAPCSGTSGFAINSLYGADGVWVASGDDSWYSTDNGVTWNDCTGTPSFSNVLYKANGIWVGGGTSGIVYSSDGKAWQKSNITSGVIDSIHYANGVFVATSHNRTTLSGILYWSTDGKTWTASSSASGDDYFATAQNHNGIWVAVSSSAGAYYSSDGKTWYASDYTGGYCRKLAYGNGIWAFSVNPSVGWNGVYYSTNGKNWIQSDLTTPTTVIHYSNGLWIAADDSSNVYYSADAKHWVKCPNMTGGYLTNIYSANGILVAGTSQSDLYYSPTWEPTIPAGDYLLSAQTVLPDTPIGENIPFTSANTTYSKMSITS